MKKATFRIVRHNRIENEVGYSDIMNLDGVAVPVTYHEVFDITGPFWQCSCAMTGTRLRGGDTKTQAKKNSLKEIKRLGEILFYQAREKFMEIAFGGVTISEYKKPTVSKTKEKRYNAWCRARRKAKEAKP